MGQRQSGLAPCPGSVGLRFTVLIEEFTRHGILSRGIDRGLLSVSTYNPRDYTEDVHRTVDDRPYGGGPGMVMKVSPLKAAIEAAVADVCESDPGGSDADKSVAPLVVFLSPQGERFTQPRAREWSTRDRPLVLIAGRYEGVDERLIERYVDCEISIGDYVLSGGEIGAMAVVDAVARLLPGVAGNEESVQADSFGEDGLLDHPHYTRPESLQGEQVPDVLTSGDHHRIRQWRRRQALQRTARRRPDLLNKAVKEGFLQQQDLDYIDSLDWSNDDQSGGNDRSGGSNRSG